MNKISKITKFIVAVTFLLVTAVSSISFLHAQGPYSNINDAVLEKLDAQRMKAISENDLATVRSLLADDYMHVNASGAISDLPDYFHHLVTRRRTFRSLDATANHEVSIRYYGDIAIMVGPEFNDQIGKGVEEYAVTSVYHKVGDSWKEVHESYSVMARPCSEAQLRQMCVK